MHLESKGPQGRQERREPLAKREWIIQANQVRKGFKGQLGFKGQQVHLELGSRGQQANLVRLG